eukprot:9478677-Pyramimonas_sp.AAC.2
MACSTTSVFSVVASPPPPADASAVICISCPANTCETVENVPLLHSTNGLIRFTFFAPFLEVRKGSDMRASVSQTTSLARR